MFVAAGPGGALVAKKQRNAVLVSIAVAAGILALFAGLAASGLIRFGGELPKPGLQAVAENTDATLVRPGRQEPAALIEPGREKIEMPADVRAWLEHLERIEKKKNDIHMDQADSAKMTARLLEGASGVTSIEDVQTLTDPEKSVPDMRVDVTKLFSEMKEPWVGLRQEFLAGPRVPAECAALAQTYESGLENIPAWIDELTNLVNSVNPEDPNVKSTADHARSSARGVGRTHKGSVDSSFIASDDLLAKICRKYDTRKWFDIHSGQFSSSGLMR